MLLSGNHRRVTAMPPISLLIIFYFILVSSAEGGFNQNITNPFISYYDIQIRFILSHLLYYFLGILVVSLIYFRSNIKKKHKPLRKYISLLSRLVLIFLATSLVSFVVLLFIAFLQVNVLSFLTYINPKFLGTEINAEVISEKLKHSVKPPVIIAGGKRNGDLIPSVIAVAQSGKDSFYGSRIIPSIPEFLVFPAKKSDAGVVMVGNTLIITEINSSDFQRISPFVAYLLIKNYFPGRNIKFYPEVRIMDKGEYLVYRQDDFSEKLKTFDEIIAQLNNNIISLSLTTDEEKLQIEENEDELKFATTRKEKEYIKCVNTGYYQSGIYQRINTKEFCQEQIKPLEETVNQLKKEEEDLNTSLLQNQDKLKQYKDYIKFYNSQKLLTEEESGYISYEFGTFIPPNEIKISLTPRNNINTPADYLNVLIHEYLHYAAFNENGKKLQSSFFDESITEFFARNIIKDNFGIETKLAYPVNIKIISQMTKRINERDLADVYFSNDQDGLEKLLDRVYEKDFYKNNIIFLETLQYLSDPDEILTLANKVMVEIGGEPLAEKDVDSSFSTSE